MFFVEDNDIVYRVEKEEFGCTVKSYDLYIEGNHIVYEILEIIYGDDRKEENIVDILAQKYSSVDDVVEALNAMIDLCEHNKILKDTCKKISQDISERQYH